MPKHLVLEKNTIFNIYSLISSGTYFVSNTNRFYICYMEWRKAFTITKWIAGIILGIMLLTSALLLIFKDNIKSYAINEANKYLNKRVHMSYIDVGIWKTFPSMTLELDNVLVYSKFDTIQTRDTAVYIQKLQLRFNPLDFFKREYNVRRIDVKNAILNLGVDEQGRVNYDFLKESEDNTVTPFEFNLEKINLINTDFSYDNKATQQFYDAYFEKLQLSGSFSEKQFILDVESLFKIEKIRSKSVNLIENQHAKCNISIQMDQINNIFEIKSADLLINELPFNIRGKVSRDSIDFYIGSTGINLADFANNFSLQELDVVGNINGKGIVNFELFIQGEQNTTTAPAIYADFEVKNGSLSDNGFSLSRINLKGEYSNGVKGGKEHITLSKLEFISLNEQFSGALSIVDFNQPRIKGNAKGTINLKAIHRLFGPFGLQHLSGDVNINGGFDLRFNQPEFNDKNITIYDLKSVLTFHNITTQLIGDERKLHIKNGQIDFHNQYAKVTDFLITLNNSSLLLEGDVGQMVDYFNGKGELILNANVFSDALFIDDLATNKNVTEEKNRDWVLPNNIRGDLNIILNSVDYSGHQYKDIKGKMSFSDHSFNFPQIEGIVSGSKVYGNLKITEERPMLIVLETNLTADKVLFKPIFEEWKNFEQTVITADNIKGQASVQLYLKAPFDLYEGVVLKNDIESNTRIVITNGALINVGAFKEITKSLRSSAAKLLISKSSANDFEKKLLNLQFDTFENEFQIKKGLLTIPKMTIKSNALDVNIEGTHTFDNDINYSLSFRLRQIIGAKQSEFGDVLDDGTGLRIYLKMFGNIDTPSFQWDKDAKKEDQREQKEQAKDDFKSALKKGFGINKKDSTISTLEDDKRIKEEKVIIDFGNDENEVEEEKEKKKKGLFDKWKKENEKPKPEFEIGD